METHKSPVTRRVIGTIILVSALVHVLALYFGTTLLSDWRWENIPVHSALEIAGSFIAFFVAYFLIALEHKGQGTTYNLPIAGAMIGMGVIDGMHALVHPGALFVWLHSTATFIGGLLFSVILLPKNWLWFIDAKWPFRVFLYTTLFSIASIVFSAHLPTMATTQGFTSVAVFLNVVGGVLLLISSIKLFLSFKRKQLTDDLLFVLHCSMFGFAAIMFEQSVLWDLTWWGWHVLRFLAYGVALWFALSSDLIAQLNREEIKNTLDDEVESKRQLLEFTQNKVEFAEHRQNALLSCLSDAVVITDERGEITTFTPAAEKMFGYSHQEMKGQSIEKLMPPKVADEHSAYMKAYVDTQTATVVGKNREMMAQRNGNRRFPIELTINTMQQGDKRYFIGIIRDITQRKKDELAIKKASHEAEQANIAKSAFLANMSHEIRTPMNGIFGTLQLLKSEPLSSKGKDFLCKAQYSCKNLLTIINDILDYSKIEANKLEIEESTISISQVLEVVSSDMMPMGTDKGIALTINNELEHDDWIGDRVRLGQILINLVSNAIKFTQQGSVDIHAYEDNEDQSLHFVVKDTGIGMDEKGLSRLFARFEQADPSTTRKFGGTGLGMSITQSLITLMGGAIDATSTENIGTRIHIKLPLQKSDQKWQKSTHHIESLAHIDLASKHILIAEDNDINQVIIGSMLEPTHARLTMAKNGEEAVELALQSPPDMILMDIQMPVMDGITACRKILAVQNVPIVALTANVMAENIKTYEDAGFTSHIGKPIEIDKLAMMLERFLGPEETIPPNT